MKNFALLKNAGCFSLRYLINIKENNNNLLASPDKFNCVGSKPIIPLNFFK